MEWQKANGCKMKLLKTISLFLILLFSFSPTFGWNNHAGITYIILQDYWKNKPPKKVKVETLDSFVLKEKNNLPGLLNDIDSFISKKLPHCPPPIAELKLDGNQITQKTAVPLFFQALRVNPHHKPALFVQSVTSIAKNPSPHLNQITTLSDKGKLVNETFVMLPQGSLVSPLDILVTAVDEPDYDLDLYLFSDSGSEVGKRYGFGEQAFGNPVYEFSSQAPFHMGFYHESNLIFSLASFLKRTYPEYRIYQFTKLSEYAFKTGHPYWGYRFAGWALHYIQDLTQPYHSSVLPRVGAAKQIGAQLLSTVGFPSLKTQVIEDVSTRHTLIEEYQYYLIKDILQKNAKEHIVSKALQNASADQMKSKIDYDSIRNLITKEAFETANEADYQLEKLGITKYEKVYPENHPIHQILAKLLAHTSHHTRVYLDAFRAP